MLVVTVEVWPGGNIRQRRVIHTLNLVNLSGLADVSDYEASFDGEPTFVVPGHERMKGAWPLVYKAIVHGERTEES